jgi:hypothetical protein
MSCIGYDPGVSERVHAHADQRPPGGHVAAEDLADADLGRPVGLVLEADQPQRDHRRGIVQRPGPHLDDTVLRCMQPLGGLLLPDDGGRAEAVLADRCAERAGEDPGLQ